MAVPAYLSICAGVGSLDLAVRLAFPGARCVGYVEREAFAASVLVARMEDEALDRAPIWDDLTTFDGRAYRNRVDLIVAGLPCQPYSVAGERKGHDDERALWPAFVRLVRECEPSVVFLENVPPFLKHAEPVWSRLLDLGFEWAPPMLATASEYGAPHERGRVFLLAAHTDRIELRQQQGRGGWAGWAGETEPGGAGQGAADAGGTGLEVGRGEQGDDGQERTAVERSGNGPPHPHGTGLPREWGGWIFDPERQTLRHDPHRCGVRCGICGTPWEAESPLVRVDDGDARRVDELRTIGNGVVPLVAAHALRTLADRMIL